MSSNIFVAHANPIAAAIPAPQHSRQPGAKADFIYLGDRGIVGNGHMMMLENNSDMLAEHIVSWIENG